METATETPAATIAALMARVKELDAALKEKDKQIQQANADHEATASRLATLTSTAATPYRTLASHASRSPPVQPASPPANPTDRETLTASLMRALAYSRVPAPTLRGRLDTPEAVSGNVHDVLAHTMRDFGTEYAAFATDPDAAAAFPVWQILQQGGLYNNPSLMIDLGISVSQTEKLPNDVLLPLLKRWAKPKLPFESELSTHRVIAGATPEASAISLMNTILVVAQQYDHPSINCSAIEAVSACISNAETKKRVKTLLKMACPEAYTKGLLAIEATLTKFVHTVDGSNRTYADGTLIPVEVINHTFAAQQQQAPYSGEYEHGDAAM